MTPGSARHRGFALFVVLWAVGIVSLLLVAVQTSAWRQAAAGREALARVRAEWAARAGVEAAISAIAYNTVEPDQTSAKTIVYDLEDAARGTLVNASYVVEHSQEDAVYDGPADAGAKININTMTKEDLLTLPYMTEDVADAILDWIDTDDDTRPLGAESGYYANLRYPYEPRNGPIRSLAELELIAGVDPIVVRGEDWNLNGVLDPNEDDGDLTWPPDNADGVLDAGWSAIITASSTDGGMGASGQPRLNLKGVDDSQLMQRLGVDAQQAAVIRTHAGADGAAMTDFITTDLNRMTDPTTNQAIDNTAQALTRDELGALLDETTFDDSEAAGLNPGKLNINSCASDILQYLPSIDPALADSIMLQRDSTAEGFTSIVDLLDVPGISRTRLAALYPLLAVRSNVYTVTSIGRDDHTGLQVQIVATIDRSTLPVTVKEVRLP